MDCKNSQEAYLSETWHIVHAGARSMDGVQTYGEGVELKRYSIERSERDPFCAAARAIDSTSSIPVSNREETRVPCRKVQGACRAAKEQSRGVIMNASESDIRFKSLVARLRGVEFSRRLAVKLLGGEKRLEKLMLQGKIHATKRQGASNTMWRFDASEVVAYVKPNKTFIV